MLPGFSAGKSLYDTRTHYRTGLSASWQGGALQPSYGATSYGAIIRCPPGNEGCGCNLVNGTYSCCHWCAVGAEGSACMRCAASACPDGCPPPSCTCTTTRCCGENCTTMPPTSC
jgi:hypothetical protein